MKLKKAKRVIYGLMAAILTALVVSAFLPVRWQGWGYFAILVLLAAFCLACVLLLRCPHCYRQIHLWGQEYCPTCGRRIEEEEK